MKKKQVIKEYVDRGVKDYDPTKKCCIVTDLDGTLALINGRGYFDASKFETDIVNVPLFELIEDLTEEDENGWAYELIIITGRSEANGGRDRTIDWLFKEGINYSRLYMRKPGDFRKDYITKSEIIQELQKEYNIICAFDDRDSSAKAFRDNGVLCLQVWEDDTETKPCKYCKDNAEFYADSEINIYCPACGRKFD